MVVLELSNCTASDKDFIHSVNNIKFKSCFCTNLEARICYIANYYLFRVILLIAWDIESNPGPSANENVSHINLTNISICHLNIRSLRTEVNGINVKLELIRHELSKNFNIITVSETWLSDSDDIND